MGETANLLIRSGNRFRALTSVAVDGVVHWRAPLTTGFSGIVPAGTVVAAVNDVPPGRSVFYARPETYGELEALLVPEEDREEAKYDGYSVVLPVGAIGRDWVAMAGPE